MPFIQFQFRRGTASTWAAANTVLADGEMGIETDTDLFKIGNGTLGWNALPYGGLTGNTGPQGPTGPQGVAGPQGPAGSFGGATFDYTFNTNTSNSDPGNGILKFNTADLTTATQLYIDKLDDSSINVHNFLVTIDDSTSTIKGHFKVSNKANPNDFALFTISSLVDNSDYFTVNCAYVSGSASSFSESEDVLITFARTGDKGDAGAAGPQGPQGPQGIAGELGPQGPDGPCGPNVPCGPEGPDGP